MALDAAQMASLDSIVVEEYHIELIMMMENAGRALAYQVREFLGGRLSNRKVLVIAGKGSNAGGGLVAARHLHNWGGHVEVLLAHEPETLRDAPLKQMRILRSMNIKVRSYPGDRKTGEFDLIIDALLGYNQRGSP